MDKLKARRRQAGRDARARPSTAGAAPGTAQPPIDDDSLLAEPTPTGMLAALAEEQDDGELDPIDQELQEEQQRQAEEQRQVKLDAFAAALSKKRQAAIDARRSSGIEDIWRQDEEFYEGIDDANRGESVTLKPRNQTGGASIVETGAAAEGSNIFLNITRPYVDMAAGRAADMLLPTDDSNWDLRETPMPDIIGAMNSNEPIRLAPGVMPKPGMPSTIGQAAQQMVEQARAKVAKAKTRIEDWLEEGQFHAEQRKQLRDAAKVGTGVLKGPIPVKRMSRAIVRGEDGSITMQVQNKTAPASLNISYWNLYPDPSCGEDIHRGSYIWECDDITARQLRDLKGTADADGVPLYIESAIDQCLKEGPQASREDDHSYYAPDTEVFRIWYYHGVATTEDLAAAGVDVDQSEALPVIITMVNNRVIKAALSTLDSGAFPYDVMIWQAREGHWAGIGVARQTRAPQRMVNAAVRNLMDNAGLGAGPQVVMMKGAVKPMGRDGRYGLRPRGMWEANPEGIDDVRKVFTAVEIPMLTNELLAIVQFGLKMAEDVTGMPMLMQGQQGQASDTVGGMQILNNNSNTPLRAIAKLFDDRVTIPHLLRYYEWLLLYGPEEEEKGEFVVAARGSSALFERDAQNQAILQMAGLVGNPAFRIDPQKWFKEALRAQRLDPDRFQYSDVEWAQLQQQQAQNPPPPDPRIQTAQIGAQARIKAAEIAAGVQQQRIKSDTDRDTVFAQNEAARTLADQQAQQNELHLKLQLAYLDYANQRQMSLDQVKAELAQTTMKLQTQKELSTMTAGLDLHKHNNPSPQVITPPTEPAGRAPAGEAFQA